MIVVSDTCLVIQLFFILGKDTLSPANHEMRMLNITHGELRGLCNSSEKDHLDGKFEIISSLFPIESHTTEIQLLIEEIEYLETQYDTLKADGETRLGSRPSRVDLEQLAVASINGFEIATVEYSLSALAKQVLENRKCKSLSEIVIQFAKDDKIAVSDLESNLSKMPDQEKLRFDHLKEIQEYIAKNLPEKSET